MSVIPLDLQTNFSQINKVGKQLSLAKESEVNKQDLLNSQIQKESTKNSEDVPETKHLEDDYAKIKDDNEKNKKDNQKQKKEKKENDDENEKNNLILKYKDPNIGSKIDVMG